MVWGFNRTQGPTLNQGRYQKVFLTLGFSWSSRLFGVTELARACLFKHMTVYLATCRAFAIFQISFRPHIESFNLKLWNGSLALGINSRFYNLPSFVMQYQGKRSCWAMKMLFIKLSNNFWACKNSGSMHKNGCNSQTVNSQLIDLLELKLKVCTTIISWLFI